MEDVCWKVCMYVGMDGACMCFIRLMEFFFGLQWEEVSEVSNLTQHPFLIFSPGLFMLELGRVLVCRDLCMYVKILQMLFEGRI